MTKTTWDDLQQLQLEFDRTHGLADVGAFQLASGEVRTVASAEFAALALAGECGEIANAVKKAVRAVHLGLDTHVHLETAKAELADALAYLFKLASILDTELADTYLETIALNSLRFASRGNTDRPPLIGVAGFDAKLVEILSRQVVSSGVLANVCHLDLAPPKEDIFLVQWMQRCCSELNTVLTADKKPLAIVLYHDPAFQVHRIRESLLVDRDRRLSAALIELLVQFEKIGWQYCGSRSLLLVAASAQPRDESTRLTQMLRAHGASLIEHSDGELAHLHIRDALVHTVSKALGLPQSPAIALR